MEDLERQDPFFLMYLTMNVMIEYLISVSNVLLRNLNFVDGYLMKIHNQTLPNHRHLTRRSYPDVYDMEKIFRKDTTVNRDSLITRVFYSCWAWMSKWDSMAEIFFEKIDSIENQMVYNNFPWFWLFVDGALDGNRHMARILLHYRPFWWITIRWQYIERWQENLVEFQSVVFGYLCDPVWKTRRLTWEYLLAIEPLHDVIFLWYAYRFHHQTLRNLFDALIIVLVYLRRCQCQSRIQHIDLIRQRERKKINDFWNIELFDQGRTWSMISILPGLWSIESVLLDDMSTKWTMMTARKTNVID